jgi:hypothetical protein
MEGLGRIFETTTALCVCGEILAECAIDLELELGIERSLPAKYEPINFRLEQFHECRLHEFVVVWNIKADHSLSRQVRCKHSGQLGLVYLLHDKDHLRPFDQLWRDWILCVWTQTRRRTFNARILRENLFGRGTTPTIPTADEENSEHELMRSNV